MRIGSNPEKSNNLIHLESYHRIVIPVYIPNTTEDYFKEALSVLKYCLESILCTVHPKTRITLINNGCCAEVRQYIEKQYQANSLIDQLFHSDQNLGKINAFYSIVKGNLEPLITVTDADVMFLPGWQQAVEKVFEDFPKAGMVSPVPAPVAYKSSFVNATFYYGLSKGILKFKEVKDPEALELFQKSIGTALYKDIHLKKYITLTQGDKQAAMGCGHFVATMRAEVFEKAPSMPSQFKIGGNSLNDYLDRPNDSAGFLRLATMDNYAYHLGNSIEPWMQGKFDAVAKEKSVVKHPNEQLLFNVKGLSYMKWLIGKICYKILVRTRPLKKIYFGFLGMKDPSF